MLRTQLLTITPERVVERQPGNKPPFDGRYRALVDG